MTGGAVQGNLLEALTNPCFRVCLAGWVTHLLLDTLLAQAL